MLYFEPVRLRKKLDINPRALYLRDVIAKVTGVTPTYIGGGLRNAFNGLANVRDYDFALPMDCLEGNSERKIKEISAALSQHQIKFLKHKHVFSNRFGELHVVAFADHDGKKIDLSFNADASAEKRAVAAFEANSGIAMDQFGTIWVHPKFERVHANKIYLLNTWLDTDWWGRQVRKRYTRYVQNHGPHKFRIALREPHPRFFRGIKHHDDLDYGFPSIF